MPEIAVVIPARNAEEHLGETLASVAANTADFECIVIDDGSTDGTAALAQAVAETDPRFQVWTGPGKGVSAARNAGICASTAPVLLFLDADDLLAPDALSRLHDGLLRSDAIAILGGIERIAEDGTPLPGDDNRALAPTTGTLAALLKKNFVVNGGALAIRREAVEAVGRFDETLAYGEDWEFWCRLADRSDFATLDGPPVLKYRQRAGGANYLAKVGEYARDVACLDRLVDNPSIRARFGDTLPRLIRARRVDIFWAGVRSELQFGSKLRALRVALTGLFLYPDSIMRPGLALRFMRSIGR